MPTFIAGKTGREAAPSYPSDGNWYGYNLTECNFLIPLKIKYGPTVWHGNLTLRIYFIKLKEPVLKSLRTSVSQNVLVVETAHRQSVVPWKAWRVRLAEGRPAPREVTAQTRGWAQGTQVDGKQQLPPQTSLGVCVAPASHGEWVPALPPAHLPHLPGPWITPERPQEDRMPHFCKIKPQRCL